MELTAEVATKYILCGLAIAFLTAGGLRARRNGGTLNPQSRTWLLVGVIFAAVSGWLFIRG